MSGPAAARDLLAEFSAFLLDLRVAVRRLSPAQLQAWVFERLAPLIPHRSGIWGGGRDPASSQVLHYSIPAICPKIA